MSEIITRQEFDSLVGRVSEMETSVGSLTGEVSSALRAIGQPPNEATGEKGHGIARTVVDTKNETARISEKIDKVYIAQDEEAKSNLTNAEIALKKVQAFGGMVTGLTGVIAIVGSIITGIIWLVSR